MREEPSSVVQIMLFISKLVKEGKMDRNEAHMLKQLILQGDETLMALIKVYEVEHDLVGIRCWMWVGVLTCVHL